MNRGIRVTAMALVCALAAALVAAPLVAAGVAADPKDGVPAGVMATGVGGTTGVGREFADAQVLSIAPQTGNSAAADGFEDDDVRTVGSTRNIEALLPRWDPETPGWGIQPLLEFHTIDLAGAAACDVDWYRLEVPAADFDEWSQLSYRFDVYSMDRTVDTVLDVFADDAFYHGPDEIYGEDDWALVSNDDCDWTHDSEYGAYGRWSSVTFIPPAAGTYWIRVRPYYSGVDGFEGAAGSYTFRAKVGQVGRLYGATRIETAVRIAQEGWPTMPADSQDTTVVLAYARNYPDALAAASLAGACGGPILLTESDALPAQVAAEITRIGAKGVYVVGGTAAIGNEVIEDLQLLLTPSRIQRVSGDTRYETAVEVMKKTREVQVARGGTPTDAAFLVCGTNFPDALAVGPMAWYQAVPVLLTRPEELHAATASAIAMYGISDVIVAGGTAAVSAAAVGELVDDGMPINRILRVSGADRYETAKEIAAWSCDLKGPGARDDDHIGTVNNPTALWSLWNASANAYASGKTYPDALAGGPFAGKAGAPLLLTPPLVGTPYLFGADGELPSGSTAWFSDLHNAGATPIVQSYLLGGTAAVSDGIFAEIDNLTGWVGGP